jgi:hypothetical protein
MRCGHSCHLKERKHSQGQGNVDFLVSKSESTLPSKGVGRESTIPWVSGIPPLAMKRGNLLGFPRILKGYPHPNALLLYHWDYVNLLDLYAYISSY